MKFAITFTALLITSIGCKETISPNAAPNSEKFAPNSECFEVSYVTGICGQAVLKIENTAFFKYGETWNGHTNVFYTVFDCLVDEVKLKQARFFVTISNNPNIDCPRCLAALDYQGSKKHSVNIVTDCNSSVVD